MESMEFWGQYIKLPVNWGNRTSLSKGILKIAASCSKPLVLQIPAYTYDQFYKVLLALYFPHLRLAAFSSHHITFRSEMKLTIFIKEPQRAHRKGSTSHKLFRHVKYCGSSQAISPERSKNYTNNVSTSEQPNLHIARA